MGKRRRLGQNFLVDDAVVERIAGALVDDPPRVLEVGPGRGALTKALVQKFPRVLAVELDGELIAGLRGAYPSVELVNGDALAVDLDQLLGADAPWQVAANLPYSVGTAIIRRLLRRGDLVRHMVVMLQREVAERLVAAPGERAHGLLALERAAWAEAWPLFDVPPGAFRPRPKVSSTVVAVRSAKPVHDPQAIADALRLAAHALTKPRKMLGNSLKPLATEAACVAADVDPTLRPGQLSLEQWVAVARYAADAAETV